MLPQCCLRSRRRVALATILVAFLPALRCQEEQKPETNVAVQVAKVIRTTMRAYVTAYGTVETAPVGGANQPAGGARLAAAASGLVVRVHGVEGARVEKGAVIVQLDSHAADPAVLRAQAAVTAAEKARARQAQLQAAEGTSERAMQEAEERLAAARGELAAAKFQQSQLAIRAPLAGTLTRLQAKPGEWLDVGKDIGEIIDPDRLVLTAQVPAAEAMALRVGQPASVLTRLGIDEKPIAKATVQYVSPQVTVGTDSVLVRLALPKGSGVRAGQFVAARIVTEERADRLAVPRESVYTSGEGESTLSIVEGDIARQRVVQTGLRDGNLIEVSGEGLAEGVTVVTLGSYALPKETKIRVLTAAKEAGK
jgi:membrane fusion protein (multidrug efflux system)